MSRRRSVDLSFLSRYGETGSLIRNELRLILRNKRPRTVAVIGLLFMLYGLLFVDNPLKDKPALPDFSGFLSDSRNVIELRTVCFHVGELLL